MKKVNVTVAGRTFPSIKAAADHFNAHLGNAIRRLRAKWPPEEALGLRSHRRKGSGGTVLHTSLGTFPTIQAAAEHFGRSASAIQARRARGWTADESCGIAVRKKQPLKRTTTRCDGRDYRNLKELADAYKQPYKRVYKRIRSGWTPEQAVNLVEPPPRFRNVDGHARDHLWKAAQMFDGKRLPKSDIGSYKLYVIRNKLTAKEYVGITICNLQSRLRGHFGSAAKGRRNHLCNAMRHYGRKAFSIELIRNDAKDYAELQRQEIAEIRRRDTIRNGYNTAQGGAIGTSKSITVAGIKFASHGAAADFHGIDSSLFNLRVGRLKWTPEQAAELERRPKFARRVVRVGQHEYKSLKSAAEGLGFDYKLVHDRVVGKGWTEEQALGLSDPPTTVRYRGITLCAFGRSFPSFNACGKHFGVKPESLRNLVINYGEAIEVAIRHLQTKPRAGRQATRKPKKAAKSTVR